jgi:hypothetical protein
MRIVGVAPGCGTHIFTAVDAFHGRSGSHSPENEHCIKIASNHYRSACGFKQHTAWLNGLLHRPGFDRMQSKISQIKGCASASALQLHVLHMVGLMEQGKALYGGLTARRWHLRVHCLQRKQFHRMAQLFVHGHTTVQGRWLSARPCTILPLPKPSVSVVGLGNASAGWGSAISRKQAAPVVSFFDFMQREYAARKDNVFVMHVDEFKTSQVCSRCWRHAPPKGMKQARVGPAGAKSSCWKLKKCVSGQECCQNLVVDRDVNAARNITEVLLKQLFEGHVDEEQQQCLNQAFSR